MCDFCEVQETERLNEDQLPVISPPGSRWRLPSMRELEAEVNYLLDCGSRAG